jgi:lipoyl(octanoyl) transferase
MSAGIPSQEWRLILSEPASGAWNMAVDESILDAVGRGDVLPTLRLYAWEPPCLSLGYAQPMSDIDLQGIHSLGWDLVRRPTGGRAILHTDELTYSIIGSHNETLLNGSLLESYSKIAQGLLTALEELGVQASIAPDDNTSSLPIKKGQEAICFESPSKFEITVNHKKLIGSAQARRKEGILQHGTLPLHGDITRITKGLAYSKEADRTAAAVRLRMRATSVAEVLNRQINWETAARAFVLGFEKQLRVKLLKTDLTAQEYKQAAILLEEKYAAQHWTFRQSN